MTGGHSSSPWLWNSSSHSPEPPVSFYLDPHVFFLSPACVEIPFLVGESGKLYYIENSVSVLLERCICSVSVDLLGHIIYTYSPLFFRVHLRETPTCSSFSALLCLALPYCSGVFRCALIRASFLQWCPGTHTSIKDMPLTQKFTLGALRFIPKDQEKPCRNLFLIVKSPAKPITMHIALQRWSKYGVKWKMEGWCRCTLQKRSSIFKHLKNNI